MKRFLNAKDFFERHIDILAGKFGYRQNIMDKYHIQVLQNYRIAAAFAVPAMNLMKNVIKTKDEKIKQGINEIIAECEKVLEDKSIYIMIGKSDSKLSEQLEEAVRKATKAISHSGNTFNNLSLLVPEKFLPIIFGARDICDWASKRITFSGV
jgi:hypothetical protein